MSPADLKQWRNALELTQVAASELLGVSRVTVQNWESETTRIPVAIEAACEFHQRRWKMRPEFGPITLTYFDVPLWQSTYGPIAVPKVTRELYPDNATAVARACALRGSPGVNNLLLLAESGDIVWNSVQLEHECRTRRSSKVKNPRAKHVP